LCVSQLNVGGIKRSKWPERADSETIIQ